MLENYKEIKKRVIEVLHKVNILGDLLKIGK